MKNIIYISSWFTQHIFLQKTYSGFLFSEGEGNLFELDKVKRFRDHLAEILAKKEDQPFVIDPPAPLEFHQAAIKSNFVLPISAHFRNFQINLRTLKYKNESIEKKLIFPFTVIDRDKELKELAFFRQLITDKNFYSLLKKPLPSYVNKDMLAKTVTGYADYIREHYAFMTELREVMSANKAAHYHPVEILKIILMAEVNKAVITPLDDLFSSLTLTSLEELVCPLKRQKKTLQCSFLFRLINNIKSHPDARYIGIYRSTMHELINPRHQADKRIFADVYSELVKDRLGDLLSNFTNGLLETSEIKSENETQKTELAVANSVPMSFLKSSFFANSCKTPEINLFSANPLNMIR